MIYREIADLFKAAAVNWVRDYAQSMGAALAFYTMFSIAPLLLIVVSVAGLVVGEDAARGEIYNQLDGTARHATGRSAVQGLLESARRPAGSAARGDLRPGRSVHRRDVGLRRTAGRPRPHLAGAGKAADARAVEPAARPAAVVRDDPRHRVPADGVAGVQRGPRGAQPVVGPAVRRLGRGRRTRSTSGSACCCRRWCSR